MKRILRILTIVLILAVAFAGVMTRADENGDVSGYIDDFRNETRCNSVSVAVINGDLVKTYGDVKGLYQIGSMTKSFTGLAVQKLISEGKVRLDAKVEEYLPGFKAFYGAEQQEITVEHLLTQTSGYTNNEKDFPPAEIGQPLQDWASKISGKELKSRPGEKYSYSNVNYNLLGAVIERVSGKTYREYMEEEILIPLGLDHTYVVVDPVEKIIKGSRLGYRHAFTYEIPVAEGRIPAGYFYSNAEDMARWMKIWIGEAEIPEEFKAIVNEVKDRLKEPGDYFSGWEVTKDGEIGHSGGTPNYSSRMVFSKTKKTGVVVLTNLNVAASTDSLCNGIFALVNGGDRAAIAKDVWTVFDIMFTAVSAAAVLVAAFAVRARKRKALLITGIFLMVIATEVCVVIPLVFGAGLGEITRVWAPYSFTGGTLLLWAAAILIFIRILLLGKNEDREKTS
ncbi:MAG: beta-lactamase family protein [Clostridiales bacterium]|nr:beta-lactamase family protein [Clostridiales bacterium]